MAQSESDRSLDLSLPQFVTAAPSHQNALDLFEGRWVSHLPAPGFRSGTMRLFAPEDPRPQQAADACGGIEGMRILELGPLEGGHTYQLEGLGASSILGIEASPEYYLKCLITKELFDLKSKFLLGDFNTYLESTDDRFDLVFASGVLYHMIDPLKTLHDIARVAPRVFIWTHYINNTAPFQPRTVDRYGYSCEYHELYYDNLYDGKSMSRSFSGVMPSACRLLQKDILGALEAYGFDQVNVVNDAPDHPNGPAITLFASKSAESARKAA